MPKQQDVAGTHDLAWKLNCTVWAQVDQQDRKKSFARADSEVVRELSLQVCKFNMQSMDCTQATIL